MVCIMLDVVAPHRPAAADPLLGAPVLDLVVPVYNEAHVLRESVQTLRDCGR